jgi:ABC-type branched-subunit amino acid transport system substrate-binding protein
VKNTTRYALFAAAFALIGVSTTSLASANPHQDDHSKPAQGHGKMVKADGKMVMMARYGGPSYGGSPALEVTASLVAAGGGPENFSIARALVAMVGEELVKAEVEKLKKQYGEEKVKIWLTVFDYAVKDALRIATEAGVKLPEGKLAGKKLAETLVLAGLDKNGTFYTEYLLDKAVTNAIHHKVMENIDAKYGIDADTVYHQITNQAMYDLAQALGAKKVKLASFH